MTTLTRFAPAARWTVTRAGMLVSDGGQGVLSTEHFLLALAEGQPLSTPVDLGVSAAMVRAKFGARAPLRQDCELLATLGIDLDEVRWRVFGATSMRLDDPSLWRLRRYRVRPLRMTLTGPANRPAPFRTGSAYVGGSPFSLIDSAPSFDFVP